MDVRVESSSVESATLEYASTEVRAEDVMRQRQLASTRLRGWQWALGAVLTASVAVRLSTDYQPLSGTAASVARAVFLGSMVGFNGVVAYRAAGGWRGWVWLAPLLALQSGLFMLGYGMVGLAAWIYAKGTTDPLEVLVWVSMAGFAALLSYGWWLLRSLAWRRSE